MQVDASVSESDVGPVRVGQPAEFTVDAFPHHPFPATVSQVRQAPITVQNVVTYDVVLAVSNPELLLKPGMTANAKIITAEQEDVLKVPLQALRFSPNGGDKSRQSEQHRRPRRPYRQPLGSRGQGAPPGPGGQRYRRRHLGRDRERRSEARRSGRNRRKQAGGHRQETAAGTAADGDAAADGNASFLIRISDLLNPARISRPNDWPSARHSWQTSS